MFTNAGEVDRSAAQMPSAAIGRSTNAVNGARSLLWNFIGQHMPVPQLTVARHGHALCSVAETGV